MNERHQLTIIPLDEYRAELELDGFRLHGVVSYELGQSVEIPLTLTVQLRLKSVRTVDAVPAAPDELPAFESRQ